MPITHRPGWATLSSLEKAMMLMRSWRRSGASAVAEAPNSGPRIRAAPSACALLVGLDGRVAGLAAVIGGERQVLGAGVEQRHLGRLLHGLADRRGCGR